MLLSCRLWRGSVLRGHALMRRSAMSSWTVAPIPSSGTPAWPRKLSERTFGTSMSSVPGPFRRRPILPSTRRHMSTTPALASFHPLIATQALLETIHAAGLPYWATIVVVTVALRTFLTLPIAVVQRTRQQRLRNLRPVILSWEQTFRRQVDMESMAAGARGSAQPEKRVGQLMRDKVEELYRTYDCHPRRTFLLPWVQLPFFLTMSLTLRYMSAFPLPFLETPDRCNPGFIYGGFSVWTDIHLPDPTWMFPLLIGATHLINVEMFAGNMVTRRQRMIINAFRVFAVASVPIATQIPVALCMFWLTSSSYSLLQSLAFRYLYPKR